MRVAIIGAGVAGLSCAHELEKYGVEPIIFERNSFIGEQYQHVGVLLEIINRPIKDGIKYIKEKFDIEIQSINTVEQLLLHSPNSTATVKGNLGYFIKRGFDSSDIKMQLYSKLRKTQILFEENADYAALTNKFDFVVIATGTPDFANEIGCWQQWFNGYIRGAMVLGDFDPNTLIMWMNRDYAKAGFAYLCPFDNKSASIILVLSDVTKKEAGYYWDLFLYTENIKYTIVEGFIQEHPGGYVYPHKVGNMYFVGNAGGALDTFIGFGVFNSIAMGVMAARFIIKKNLQLYQFRKSYNSFTNEGYDALITSIGLPGIKNLIYNSPLNIIKYGSYLLKYAMDRGNK